MNEFSVVNIQVSVYFGLPEVKVEKVFSKDGTPICKICGADDSCEH